MTQQAQLKPRPSAVVPKYGKQVDRDLAEALEGLLASPHADSECNGSVAPIILEAATWIGLAGLAWILVAFAI